MTHKPEKKAVAKHLTNLRREALAALKHYDTIADRLNFYERYLALSKTYDVRLAGPFLVIRGGQSRERTRMGAGESEYNLQSLREVK
jgi:hypothetical protein